MYKINKIPKHLLPLGNGQNDKRYKEEEMWENEKDVERYMKNQKRMFDLTVKHNKKITTKKQIVALYKQGYKQIEIASKVRRTKQWVNYVLNKAKLL